MRVKDFKDLVELRTKVASVIPFTIGILYAVYNYGNISIKNSFVFFLSMISIDMATTAINNYTDYKSSSYREGYNFKVHNVINRESLSPEKVKAIIFTLLSFGAAMGIYLVTITDFMVLIIGALGFAIGITYSYGPIPISRTPLGELFSGALMGGAIFFVAVYINITATQLISVSYIFSRLIVNLMILDIVKIIIASIPLIIMISNIMLANNLCDMESDLHNKRFTLPIYIGKKAGLGLYNLGYILVYFFVLINIVINAYPIMTLLILLSIPKVYKNIKEFNVRQSKKDTFKLSVVNFTLISSQIIIGFIVQLLVDLI